MSLSKYFIYFKDIYLPYCERFRTFFKSRTNRYRATILLDVICILIALTQPQSQNVLRIISPLASSLIPLQPLTQSKSAYEVFGFAPYWNLEKLDNVDFNVLTTFAYFGIEVDGYGNLVTEDPGFEGFYSDKATALFKKAHAHKTRVVLTLTQMQNSSILALMDDLDAQNNAIAQAVSQVKKRGIDGINIDFEYTGDPGGEYRDKFSTFVTNLTNEMHAEIPGSSVSVSVYASAVKDPKIYDIAKLAKNDIKIFMMAYDFAVAGSDNAIPTAPLYGHKENKYWYDISTAVEDFLTHMPASKLILGIPLYGYNYLVYEPKVKAQTRPYWSWRGTPKAQTYDVVQDTITPAMEGVDDYKTGWDEYGKVKWIAYHVVDTDTWRMIFLDDHQSLNIKYDFAKNKQLAGVGMWALGFDSGKDELWALLRQKFGAKLASSKTGK